MVYLLPSSPTTIVDPLRSVRVGPSVTDVVELQVKKQEHILLSKSIAEATCWSEDSVHWVAQAAESATSNSEVSAADPTQVVSAMGERT